MPTDSVLIEQCAAAIIEHRQLPPMPKGLTLPEAHALQAALIARIAPDGPAGLKAGVTTPGAQQALGIGDSLLGRLYPHGQLASGARVARRPKLAIECEIGIVVDAAGKPVSMGPALEVVEVLFARPEELTAANLVATNLAADQFLKGPQRPWADVFAGDFSVRLSRDGSLLMEAPMRESMGGPEPALAWMIKEAATVGAPIADGMLFMTGTCGGVIPALPGHYVADYGDLGLVELTIT